MNQTAAKAEMGYVIACWLLAGTPSYGTLPLAGQPDAKQTFWNQLDKPGQKVNLGVAYWIELIRADKSYRCNNKFAFHSGDTIRIHMIPNTDGYAYIVLKSGSRGDKAVLFPGPKSGMDNHVLGGRDYVLPTTAVLKFDNDPGTETLSLIFSRKTVDVEKYLDTNYEEKVVVSASGAKDLVPTRMRLCWDDPIPVIIPHELLAQANGQGGSKDAQLNKPVDVTGQMPSAIRLEGSLVTVVHNDPDGVLTVDVALEHL
ncbi:MAG: DUF4384 domain-containing protein [Candidatus Melainabacteria bacterium]|nr:DUF4384 domain-containing protein [Candidatus Melainabacteria bacterium]